MHNKHDSVGWGDELHRLAFALYQKRQVRLTLDNLQKSVIVIASV